MGGQTTIRIDGADPFVVSHAMQRGLAVVAANDGRARQSNVTGSANGDHTVYWQTVTSLQRAGLITVSQVGPCVDFLRLALTPLGVRACHALGLAVA